MRCVKKLSFISRSKLIDIKSDLVIIPLYSSALNAENWGEEREILEQLKDLFQRDIYTDLKRLKFTAVSFSDCVLYAPSQMEALSVALVGLGEKRDFSEVDERKFFRILGGQISRLCSAGDYKTVAIVGVKDSSFLSAQNQEVLCEGIELGAYKFDRYKWKRKNSVGTDDGVIQELQFVAMSDSSFELQQADLHFNKVMLDALFLARDLVNTPPNDCTPEAMVELCRKIAVEKSLSLEIYDKEKLRQVGANGILMAGIGSAQEPYFVKLTYKPDGGAKAKIALVGKGVTYDSGGLSLKHGDKMALMKCDMAGAASIVAVMQGLGELRPDLEVSAYLPLIENLINGEAVKPGDVVRTLSGKTVEVVNTDCEGRMILADAIEFANRDCPDVLIDVATLTFSVMTALGDDIAALYSNNVELAKSLLVAGAMEGENLWEMPMPEEYRKNNQCLIADLKNAPDSFCGSISAAWFLREFLAPNIRWAHLDVSGVVYSTVNRFNKCYGATGFATKTLLRFLLEAAEKKNL